MGNEESKYTFGNFAKLMCLAFAVWLISGAAIYSYIDNWDDRGTFGDMFGSINALFSVLAFVGIIFTVLMQREELRLQREELKLARIENAKMAKAQIKTADAQSNMLKLSQTNSVRETTDKIYREWYSERLEKLRYYFYSEFLPKHYSKLENIGMKMIEKEIKADEGRARMLCYWFDRVGWLAAAGLIDIDYIMGPMQQSLRQVWLTMQEFIKRERQSDGPEGMDAVYLLGIEWLFRRSSNELHHQAYIIERRFDEPSLFSRKEAEDLRLAMVEDEERFFKKHNKRRSRYQAKTLRAQKG